VAIEKKSFSKTKYQNIKIHKDGITFWFDFTIDKKRYSKIWKSSPSHGKIDKLRTAHQELERYRGEVAHKNTISADINATVKEYWEKLKLVKGWKSKLIKEYDNYYARNLSKLSNIKIKNMKPAHFTSLNASLSHLSLRSKLKAYEILKPLFELAVEDEIILVSPIKKSHVPKRKQLEEKKVVTDAVTKYKTIHKVLHRLYGSEELIILDDGTKIQCSNNPLYRAIFLFGFYGRRIGEVTQLHWEDIDFNSNAYTVRGVTSKVNTDMTFNLPSDVREALLEFKDTTGSIFPIKRVDRQYWKVRAITGIEEYTYHWMRNLSVSALSSMGVEITHLSAMLGHTDSGTIRKYLSLQREESTSITNAISQKLLK